MSDRHPLVPNPELAAKIRRDFKVGDDNLPLNLTPEEREAAQRAEAVTEPNIQLPPDVPVSPNGAAVINGSAIALKVAAVLVGIAGAMLVQDFFPQTQVDEKIAGAVIAIGSMLGIASPGLRRK